MAETFDTIEKFFEGIRDERGTRANTATRIGNALLMVLSYIKDGSFLRKDIADETYYLLKLLGGTISKYVKSEDFASGMNGSGFGMYDENGNAIVETDRLVVRQKAFFTALEILRYKVVGGNLIFGGASNKITKVETLTDVYRCYFAAEDSTAAITNSWEKDDQAICQTFNIRDGIYEGVTNRFYWRRVMDTGIGYVDLSITDCADGSDIPAVDDEIVQRGNRTDADRQSFLELDVVGDKAPAFIQYTGVSGYTLNGKTYTTIGPKIGNYFKAKKFEIDLGNGATVRIPADMGAWKPSMICYYYFRVTHNGSLWLCVTTNENGTTAEPSEDSTEWQKQVASGNDGADANNVITQYSVDGKTNWHEGYVDGDIYMRTSADGGTTWTKAMKFIGDGGNAGANGITLLLSPETLEFATGDDGVATGSQTCKLTYQQDGATAKAVTDVAITAINGLDRNPSVADNVITLSSGLISKQTVSKKEVSVGSGYIDFTAKCGTVTMAGRIRFNVSINALWGSVVATNASLETAYGHIKTIDGEITTLESKVEQTAESLTSTITKVNSQGEDISEIKQTSDEISLKVNKQSVKRNLLNGSAFRNLKEVTWNGDSSKCSIVKGGGYGGENAVYINSSSTSNIFSGIIFKNVAVTAGKTYTLSAAVKSPDITGFGSVGGVEVKFYNSAGTEVDGRVGGSLIPATNGTWEIKVLTFTAPTAATYVDIPMYVISSGQLYISRAMLEEGSEYAGWSMSAADTDFLLATGIDILNGRITATADNFVVQANDGTNIAVFGIDENGQPYLNADLINADKVTARMVAQPFDRYTDDTAFWNGKSMSWIVTTGVTVSGISGFGNGVTVNIYNATMGEITFKANIGTGFASGTGFSSLCTVHLPAHTLFRAISTDSGADNTDGSKVMFLYPLVRCKITAADPTNCYVLSFNEAISF